MSEPTTDQERIDHLWNRLDAMNGENATLKDRVSAAESIIMVKQREGDALREQVRQLHREKAELGVELNQARQAAANSVREYIEESKAG